MAERNFLEQDHLESSSIENGRVSVVDATGKVVHQTSFKQDNPIDLSFLPSGSFLIVVKYEEGVVVKRVVKL
ncbi:MAG: T9SS type A sorting domain-containing protein [Cryomorphaceae bacterium]|nr:T9SS type A sorting domain-containing protein [Cryomorphaceae bacterium]